MYVCFFFVLSKVPEVFPPPRFVIGNVKLQKAHRNLFNQSATTHSRIAPTVT